MLSYAQRKAERAFRGCPRVYGPPNACRNTWTGPMPEDGSPMMIVEGRYRRERQRAVYELKHGLTRPTDRIVATCGSDRCADVRHLRVIPAPKPPKAPRPSRARVAASATPDDLDSDLTPPVAGH